MAKALSSSRIAVGVFGAPHGVRGEVRLKSYTGDPLAIATYAPLTDETGERRFRIKSIRPIKDDMVVVSIEGVSDRDKAAALTRKEIFVTRDQLPPPDDDEFYHADLIGLNTVDEAGVAFGRVTALHNFGAGDLLELAGLGGEETGFSLARANVDEMIKRDLCFHRLFENDFQMAAGDGLIKSGVLEVGPHGGL